MLFNSYIFIFLFLPLTLIGYFTLCKFNKIRSAKTLLIFASLYFYAYFNFSYLIIILLSILVNFSIGSLLHLEGRSKRERKFLSIIGVVFNLGIIAYFKYYDFFISNINLIFKTDIPILNILLPLGISFFTFQQLSFIIDTYKGKSIKYDFLSYCLFVTFFPQLIAGPIVLPSEMIPQFEDKKNKSINFKNVNRGIYIFSMGLAKKVLIADSVSAYANTGFDEMHSLNFIEGWITSLSYTTQIYFDFSGYCDMAIGIALMFNIVLPLNFNSPYRSKNIQEFWKRWHITLGRFFTNYLYIPLGGNRKGPQRTLLNLLLVFLASGLWHGAGWTFILWGGLHGMAILIHRIWRISGKKMNKILALFITFNVVNIFWVFFRATNLQDAFKVLSAMVNIKTIPQLISRTFLDEAMPPVLKNHITLMILMVGILLLFKSKNSYWQMQNMKLNRRTLLATTTYFILSSIFLTRIAEFIYYNF